MKPLTDAQIETHIYVQLRQADLEILPTEFPINEWLRPRADAARVQKIYRPIKRELEREFQPPKPEIASNHRRRKIGDQ